jgi:hypothetical protein
MAGYENQLTINGAFMIEIKDAHSDYRSALDTLREYCSKECERDRVVRECGIFLHRLRALFATQCQLEETYGYVRIQPGSLHSRSSSDVATVFSQHREISLLLMELSERFDDLQYQGNIRREIDSFMPNLRFLWSRLDNHERTELQLAIQATSKASNG